MTATFIRGLVTHGVPSSSLLTVPGPTWQVDMDAEKAPRVIGVTRIAFLDDELLVMRSPFIDETVFVWTRPGAVDPPDVDVEPPSASGALPKSIAAALRARDKKTKRPGNGDRGGIPKYN